MHHLTLNPSNIVENIHGEWKIINFELVNNNRDDIHDVI